MQIRIDDLGGSDIQALLREHLQAMTLHSPPESIHALDLDGLRGPDLTFWTVRDDGVLLGCGALRQLDATHGEIKSMRTLAGHLRRGVAQRMLDHIVIEAVHRGYRRLSLETGSADAFVPARTMYTRAGFVGCGPFADYVEDPYSVFMTKAL